MLKRVISGTVYAALLLGFFLMKIYLPNPWGSLAFDALIFFFSIVGTREMLRAVGTLVTKSEKTIVTIFSLVCVPACALAEAFAGGGVYAVAGCTLALCVALLCLLVLKNAETRVENLGSAFVCAVYPTLLLCALTMLNHFVGKEGALFTDSVLAMLFVFIIAPVSDVMAFFTGMGLHKKFPKKFAPTISPNKTVIGFIGGVLGGALAGVGIYFVYNAICGDFTNMYIGLPVYLLVGLTASVASAFGDLVESAIKRERGIKDMGNIMPGHGGVLDRIDGTMFTAVVVYAAFLLAGLFV